MLYTRKGDGGTSGLFGTRERLPKDDHLFEALGTVDELNSLLGLCRTLSPQDSMLLRAQECLFILQAELAGTEKSVTGEQVDALEADIEEIEKDIRNPHSFVIPGSNPLSALFDYARTVTRRAERRVIAAGKASPSSRAYLNRLSSLLYALARKSGQEDGEISPTY